MSKVCVVIKARNEEEALPNTLRMLQAQTAQPHKIIVVDDGSTDRTAEIARKMECLVVSLPYHEESHIGRPALAAVFNAGLNLVPKNCSYVLLLDADHQLPSNYIEELVKRMHRDSKLVIAGGVIKSEESIETYVRGSGRLVKTKWWKQLNGMKYPVKDGWEPWLYYKAISLNLGARSFTDLVTSARPTSLTSSKARELGKSMKSLGYDSKYALGRVALIFLRGHFKASFAMLQGYLLPVKRLDIADWVGQYQKRTLWNRLKDLLGG